MINVIGLLKKHKASIIVAISIIYLDLLLISFNLALASTTSNSTNSTSRETTSEGCGTGFGYYKDDNDPKYYPLDKIGHPPPEDIVFCAALGCPYNPPDLSNIQSP
jgi:hypothetical protein